MTLGEYPDKVPAPYLIPLDRFRSKIDVGRFPNVAARVGLDALGENYAGGCIVNDFNGDSLLDALMTNLDPGAGRGYSSIAATALSRSAGRRPAWPTRSGPPTRPMRITTTTATSMCCCCEGDGSGPSVPR